jgi:uncharacterized heparinase superfamily protein
VNWIKWALAGNELSLTCVQSLALQVRWLEQRLERHLLGNHLFSNAKALMFAGVFFEGPEAVRWLTLGAGILTEEIPEQILPDGGHFERSTMYHALALEDLLDLINLAAVPAGMPVSPMASVAAVCRSRVEAMRVWLATMSHPDGEISFFNDSAIGIAPSPSELDRYAGRLGFPAVSPPPFGVVHLKESGYVRLSSAEAVALVDVAPLGPDYLPAHGHADTLSFELSLFGQRVIVNSGTSRYGVGEERLRQRGTAAHNTVVIDHTDSSEVWAGFRVGHRARPFDVRITTGATTELEASHDGYRRLAGAPVHRRRWLLEPTMLTISDDISGPFGRAEARFHLHPLVEPAHASGEDLLVLHLPDALRATLRADGGTLRVERSTWHPRFGEDVPNQCVVAQFAGASLRVRLEWSSET